MSTIQNIKRGPSVRWLLLVISSIVLVLPIFAMLALDVYQNHLVRGTETNLIHQAVLIGELYRNAYTKEIDSADPHTADFKPPSKKNEHYAPIDPIIDITQGIAPSLADPLITAKEQTDAKWRAGNAISATIKRAQFFNLYGASVVNENGCLVSSTGNWQGRCIQNLPEIKTALNGQYAAIARKRQSDEPEPPFASIKRRGDIRIFIALPVFLNQKVLAVVWMSRTSMDPLKAAWLNRKPLIFGLLAVVFLSGLLSVLLAWTITRPLVKITQSAKARAEGKKPKQGPTGYVPAEIYNLSNALDTMTKQLSDRAEYIAEFAANVSHELKSPITAIKGACELIIEEGQEMPPQMHQKFMSNIYADASRMQRLTKGHLQLAKIQSAPQKAELINIKKLLLNITKNHAAHVEITLEQDAGPLSMNPDHLESALKNLIDNGIRASQTAINARGRGVDSLVTTDSDQNQQQPSDTFGQAEKQILVKISVYQQDDQFVFEVLDFGLGIPKANQDKVFNRFFTTEKDSGGTGLGLAIVKAVAETRGGTVSFITNEEGTVFKLIV